MGSCSGTVSRSVCANNLVEGGAVIDLKAFKILQ